MKITAEQIESSALQTDFRTLAGIAHEDLTEGNTTARAWKIALIAAVMHIQKIETKKGKKNAL